MHLVKTASGCKDIDDLKGWIKSHTVGQKVVFWSRRCPRLELDLVENGSVYFVCGKFIMARCKIAGIRKTRDREGNRWTAIMMKSDLVLTELKQKRAFPGWRYIKDEDIPNDGFFQNYPENFSSEVERALYNLKLI